MPNALQNQVLVLNRLWQPVNVCSARRAIGLLFLGHAQVVGTFEDNLYSTHNFESWARLEDGPEGWPVVHTVSDWFWLPTIIVLTVFDRFPRKEIKFSRENVFQRVRLLLLFGAAEVTKSSSWTNSLAINHFFGVSQKAPGRPF